MQRISRLTSIFLATLCAFLLPANTHAQEQETTAPQRISAALHASGIARLAVQSEGVESALSTFARGQVNAITGRLRFERRDPLYTVLAMIYDRPTWASKKFIPIENPQLASALGLDPAGRHRVSIDWLTQSHEAHSMVFSEGSQAERALDGRARNALNHLRNRLAAFIALPQEFRLVPVGAANDMWATPFDAANPGQIEDATVAFAVARARGSGSRVTSAVLDLHAAVQHLFATGASEDLPDCVTGLEHTLADNPDYPSRAHRVLDDRNTRYRPFHVAALLHLVAVPLFAVWLVRLKRGWWRAAFALLAIGCVAVLVALGMRWYLAGRMPLSNLYESATFTLGAFAAAALGFELRDRRGWIGLSAAVAGWALLTAANALPLHMRRIEPLIAVLNSAWLSFHVSTLMISYACFLLSFIVSGLYLWKDARGDRQGIVPQKRTLERLNYRTIQLGWPLLTIGIVLGAVWADTAWGRFWSWDPKETMAFVTWLVYAFYLHTRTYGNWAGRRSIVVSLIGFAMVLLTYFGVNYLPLLSGGLHSYT